LLALAPAPELGVDLHDLVRDTALDLGLGLVRIQADHRRIEDVFADA
jgi:ABC-2 type transport system ATP-binding protein